MKTRNCFIGVGILLMFFAISCRKGGVPQQNSDDVYSKLNAAGLGSGLVAFSPVPSGDVSDLSAIGVALAGKQVIGMGEANHGSAEFQTVKHRFFQMLAQTQGFRALVIEENFSAVVPLNQYLVSGQGDLDALLRGLRSSMFKTREFRALMAWIRQYNTAKGETDKLQVFGMDAQNTGYSARTIQQSVSAADPGYLAAFNLDAASFLADLRNYASEQDAVKDLPNLKNAIGRVRARISQNNSLYSAALGTQGYSQLMQHVRVIEQALDQYSGFTVKAGKGFEVRDANMAENVAWVESYLGTGTRIMVWVHNGHINLQKQDYFADGAFPVLGTNLKARYASKFYSIGFVFHQGKVKAVNAGTGTDEVFNLSPLPGNVLSGALLKFGKPCFYYGISNGNAAVRTVLGSSFQVYQLGATYDNKVSNAIWNYNISAEFDGIIFLDAVSSQTPM